MIFLLLTVSIPNIFILRSINNTQSARKINQAVNNTLSNAKSTFSMWLSNLSQKDDLPKDAMSMESREEIEEVEHQIEQV